MRPHDVQEDCHTFQSFVFWYNTVWFQFSASFHSQSTLCNENEPCAFVVSYVDSDVQQKLICIKNCIFCSKHTHIGTNIRTDEWLAGEFKWPKLHIFRSFWYTCMGQTLKLKYKALDMLKKLAHCGPGFDIPSLFFKAKCVLTCLRPPYRF